MSTHEDVDLLMDLSYRISRQIYQGVECENFVELMNDCHRSAMRLLQELKRSNTMQTDEESAKSATQPLSNPENHIENESGDGAIEFLRRVSSRRPENFGKRF